MRKIVLIIGLSVCFILSWAYKNPSYNEDNSDMALLYRILPDSIHSMLHNKPILFYSYGHYGYSWAIATKTEDNIRVFSGRVSYSGDCYLENPRGRNRFDSAAFFLANKSLLSWGIDSISTESLTMKPIKCDSCISIHSILSVIDSCGKTVFNSDNTIAFSGPDSLKFNNKFHKLCLIMRWLSDPEIRPYITDSMISM